MPPKSSYPVPVRQIADGPGPDRRRPDHSFYPMPLEEMSTNERNQIAGRSLRRRNLIPYQCQDKAHAHNAARDLSKRKGVRRPALEVIVAYHPDHGWWIFPESHPKDMLTERGRFYDGVYMHPNPHYSSAQRAVDELEHLLDVNAEALSRATSKNARTALIDEATRLNRDVVPLRREAVAAHNDPPSWDITILDKRTHEETHHTERNHSSKAAMVAALDKAINTNVDGAILDCVLVDAHWGDQTQYHPPSSPVLTKAVDPAPNIEERILKADASGIEYSTLHAYLDA